MKEFTTALWNKTTSHFVSGMQQNSTPPPLSLILGITAGVVVVVVVMVGLLMWWKVVVKPIRGFYSVIKQNHIRHQSQV
jgi:hypothetical protein